MESNLNSMLAAYEALPDKATPQAGLLQTMVCRREEEVRALIRRMILTVCQAQRWSMSRLDAELLALEARPVTDLEYYRRSLQRQYEAAVSTLA